MHISVYKVIVYGIHIKRTGHSRRCAAKAIDLYSLAKIQKPNVNTIHIYGRLEISWKILFINLVCRFQFEEANKRETSWQIS